MNTDRVFGAMVAAAGSSKELARRLGVSPQAISNWRADKSIPVKHCKAIESMCGVSVKKLRPDDWAAYWPELGKHARRSADKAAA